MLGRLAMCLNDWSDTASSLSFPIFILISCPGAARQCTVFDGGLLSHAGSSTFWETVFDSSVDLKKTVVGTLYLMHYSNEKVIEQSLASCKPVESNESMRLIDVLIPPS